mmetsp:Transcript_20496/g.58277  ORF Transcript_20496/g.58277 Transcript_20496/m.58277 type:complete len:563 (+) Transcript_20496:3-1691(+)
MELKHAQHLREKAEEIQLLRRQVGTIRHDPVTTAETPNPVVSERSRHGDTGETTEPSLDGSSVKPFDEVDQDHGDAFTKATSAVPATNIPGQNPSAVTSTTVVHHMAMSPPMLTVANKRQATPTTAMTSTMTASTPSKPAGAFADTIDVSPIQPDGHDGDNDHYAEYGGGMTFAAPSFDVNSEDYDEDGNRIGAAAALHRDGADDGSNASMDMNVSIDELMNDIQQMTMERTQLLDDINGHNQNHGHDHGGDSQFEARGSVSFDALDSISQIDGGDHVDGDGSVSASDRMVRQGGGVEPSSTAVVQQNGILEREESLLFHAQSQQDNSKVLDQTISLMEKMIDLVHCDKRDESVNSKEASVLDQLEVLSELLNETDQQASLDRITSILRGPSVLERDEMQRREQRQQQMAMTTMSKKKTNDSMLARSSHRRFIASSSAPQDSSVLTASGMIHDNDDDTGNHYGYDHEGRPITFVQQSRGASGYNDATQLLLAELAQELRDKIAFFDGERLAWRAEQHHQQHSYCRRRCRRRCRESSRTATQRSSPPLPYLEHQQHSMAEIIA